MKRKIERHFYGINSNKVVFESAEGVSQSDRSKLAVQVQTIEVKMVDPASQNLKVFFILRHTQLDLCARKMQLTDKSFSLYQ